MIWTGPLFAALPGIVHGFTGSVDSMGEPLDVGTGGDEAAWERATAMLGVRGWPVAWLRQVHGAGVVRATTGGLQGDADVVVTERPQLLVAVRTADCVPIALGGEGIVGAVHAGWRGLVAGAVEAGIDAMEGRATRAVVGPCICVRCYEVGDEVCAGLATRADPAVFVTQAEGGRPHVDLAALAVHLLESKGVATERLALCTRCGSGLTSGSGLHSHRRDGERAGRQAVLVGLR